MAITFDDGWESVFTIARPILDRYGYKATLYAVTGRIGTEGYVRTDQLKLLGDAGWCIGSHTQTHPVLPKLDEDQVYDELAHSQLWLIENGFINGSRHFAFPYGGYNRSVLRIVQSLYDTAVTTHKRPVRLPLDKAYLLPRQGLGSSRLNSGYSVERARRLLEKVEKSHRCQIVYLHKIGPGGEWSPEQFEEIIDYVHALGLKVLTIEDIAKSYLSKMKYAHNPG